MSVSKLRRSRNLAREFSKKAAPAVVGPCLAALRQACAPHRDDMVGLAPVFDRIGRHLDCALSQPISDDVLYARGGRLIIVVSDKIWRTAMSTSFSECDIHRLVSHAAACLAEGRVGAATAMRVSARFWELWSQHAVDSFRSGDIAWNGTAGAALGVLLSDMPAALHEMRSTLADGKTPVLAIALNTGGFKRSIRAVVFTMPSWARAFGVVAGHA